MATSVILPKQGQSVETCIITEWYKKKGDRVEKGELLFAYETDKSSFEEEAQEAGILLEVYYEAGDEVAVLSEVAMIGEEGEKVEAAKPASGTEAQLSMETQLETAETPVVEEAAASENSVTEVQTIPAKTNGKLRISPRARKMADLKGVAIENIPGTGPNGRIIVRDIEATAGGAIEIAAAEEPAEKPDRAEEPAEKPDRAEKPVEKHFEEPVAEQVSQPSAAPVISGDFQDTPLSNMRKLIARAMHASLQNSAQLTHHLSADARSILSLRKKIKKKQDEGYPQNITLNDMICFAVVRALKKHPDANTHFMGESIRRFRKIHLGIAVDTERGLMVPVLRNADDLSLAGLSTQISELAAACRSGKIDPDLLQPEAATFTVSNLGNYGVEMFTPVINLPQVAILGVNTILERPARMEDGTFGFVPYLGLSLTYDHRALDGGPATLFLAGIKEEVEQFNHELINL